LDLATAVNLLLAIEGEMVGIFADDDIAYKAGTGQALVDDPRRKFGHGDLRLALLFTEIFGTAVTINKEDGGFVIEFLGDLLADDSFGLPAAGFFTFGNVEEDVVSGEMTRDVKTSVAL
jgi:hypothetical protein